jgi:phosphate starvation-inducible PhoH-like protein
MRKKNRSNQQPVSRAKSKKNIEQEKRSSLKIVEAKTENHKDYIQSILNNEITICVGPAGSGKSYIPAGMFAQYLHSGKYNQIIATRPLVCTGKDIGSLPGEMNEKIAPYLKPIEENFKNFFGPINYGRHFNDGRIRYEPLELMRGATFSNSLMILDEAQNCTLDQIKMFITRMGEHSKIVINGDLKQTDIRGLNGLNIIMSKLSSIAGIGICRLTVDDIQRNGILGQVLKALEE